MRKKYEKKSWSIKTKLKSWKEQDKKGTYCWVPLTYSFRKYKLINRDGKWVVHTLCTRDAAGGTVGTHYLTGMRKQLLWVVFTDWILLMFTWAYTYIKTDQIVQCKYVKFIVYNTTNFFKRTWKETIRNGNQFRTWHSTKITMHFFLKTVGIPSIHTQRHCNLI